MTPSTSRFAPLRSVLPGPRASCYCRRGSRPATTRATTPASSESRRSPPLTAVAEVLITRNTKPQADRDIDLTAEPDMTPSPSAFPQSTWCSRRETGAPEWASPARRVARIVSQEYPLAVNDGVPGSLVGGESHAPSPRSSSGISLQPIRCACERSPRRWASRRPRKRAMHAQDAPSDCRGRVYRDRGDALCDGRPAVAHSVRSGRIDVHLALRVGRVRSTHGLAGRRPFAIAGGDEPAGVREFDATFAMLKAAPYRARLARTFDASPTRLVHLLRPGSPVAVM